jgi:uncharacterized membrane protein required for colicin V production
MASFTFIIWFLIILAAVVGAMRGWTKELLVLWSGVLALFIIEVAEKYIVYVGTLVAVPEKEFWFRTLVMVMMVFFGYETPRISLFAAVTHREKLQDSLLGMFFGAVNGWLFFGSIWAFLHKVDYLLGSDGIYSKLFIPPEAGTEIGDAALKLLSRMPPELSVFDAPGIYIILAVVSVAIVILLV